MSIVLLQSLSLIAAVTSALLAGVYFIFHNTIMTVLDQQNAIATMQRINQVILNKGFLTIFFLSPLSSLLLLVTGFMLDELGFQSLLFIGALTAIIGFMVTAFFNVPLNNALAAAGEDKNAMLVWQRYTKNWGNWNYYRLWLSTLSCIGIISHFVFQT
ncbi:DUF1772 domain-containing protein [Motilimonas cestriensis]|uniref:DUF1772 domain-containing protein n=1 Tax=Motilimonas cestriensis TaxID=2742685 RepID=A0ABS8W8C5_9GAMM|nr:anthrone oxygenase family protein [Motilimonas cestriensis]MCE2593645.1 DUF1772 domain-containing protein [Motilimonas cestriensis]